MPQVSRQEAQHATVALEAQEELLQDGLEVYKKYYCGMCHWLKAAGKVLSGRLTTRWASLPGRAFRIPATPVKRQHRLNTSAGASCSQRLISHLTSAVGEVNKNLAAPIGMASTRAHPATGVLLKGLTVNITEMHTISGIVSNIYPNEMKPQSFVAQ